MALSSWEAPVGSNASTGPHLCELVVTGKPIQPLQSSQVTANQNDHHPNHLRARNVPEMARLDIAVIEIFKHQRSILKR